MMNDAADLLALFAKLNRTIDAQQIQIDALQAEVARPQTYKVDDGWVVADAGGWLPGVYETEEAALAAATKGRA